MRQSIALGHNPNDAIGDPEGLVLDPHELQMSASSVILAKGIADKLEKIYPGWLWAVNLDEAGGVVNLFSMRLSGQLGYTLHTRDVQEDASFRTVMRAAGELLERFGYRRGGFSESEYRAGRRKFGAPVADVSDWSKRGQRDYRTRQLQHGIESGQVRVLMDSDIGAARRVVR